MNGIRPARIFACLVTATVAAACLFPAAASGHGLLQVDVLTRQDVFVPQWAIGGEYAVAPQLNAELNERLRALRVAGTPVKVALIAQRGDLVDATMFFDQPVAYASFLDELLVTLRIYDGPLVVVMPNGSAEITGGGTAHPLPGRPRMKDEWDVDALVRTAIAAVNRIGDAQQRAQPKTTGSQRRGGGIPLWAIVAVAAALACGLLAAAAVRLRPRPDAHVQSQ